MADTGEDDERNLRGNPRLERKSFLVYRWLLTASREIILISLVAISIGCKEDHASVQAAHTHTTWPLADRYGTGHDRPFTYQVISGTRLKIDGHPCRLLGLKDKKDSNIRDLAKSRLDALMKDYYSYLYIWNKTEPLQVDGESIIWIGFPSSEGTELNLRLAREGFVDVDLESFQDYDFLIETKSKSEKSKWRERLSELAEKDRRKE